MRQDEVLRGFREARREFCNKCQVGYFTSRAWINYYRGVLIGKLCVLYDLNIISQREYRDSQFKIDNAHQYYIDRIIKGENYDLKK